MKIAYLLGSLNRGGTETLLLDCFRNATQAAFPFIGIYRKEGVLSDDFRATNVPMIKCFPKSKVYPGYFYRLRKTLLNNEITIVHAQQPLDAIYACIATIGTGINVVLTFHGYDFDAGTFEKWLIRGIIKRVNTNIFVSNAQQDYYHRQYRFSRKKSIVVSNGISFEKMTIPVSNDLRSELNIAHDTLLMGSVGNFGAVRDQFTICRFLKLLDKRGIDFHFVFAGGKNRGEEWRYDQCVTFCLENGLQNKVVFLGGRPDIPDILSQLEAFIYSTDHDTFGIAVIEAMASGLPVFVNDWQVMREITGNGRYAHLYATKEADDLLRQFLHFLANKEQYQKEAATAAIWAKEQYSIEQHLVRLYNIYVELRN